MAAVVALPVVSTHIFLFPIAVVLHVTFVTVYARRLARTPKTYRPISGSGTNSVTTASSVATSSINGSGARSMRTPSKSISQRNVFIFFCLFRFFGLNFLL